MKLILRVIGSLVLGLILVIGGYAAYISATWDKDHSSTEKPPVRASTDPEVIARGEYLAHSVAHCSICHAPLEVTLKRQPGEHPGMPGGFEWKMGPLGTLYSRNITNDQETGIGSWTDEELARAIKWGVGRDGKLLTFMALSVPAMADEDLAAIVSYLRVAPTIRQENKPHQPTIITKWMSSVLSPDFRKPFLEKLKYVAPAEEPSVQRGEYLARGPGACIGCHTGFDMMEMKLTGTEFAGNRQAEPDMDDPKMVYRMPNLTPDPETGVMAKWDEALFVARFRAGRGFKGSKMPWEAFREMTDADLRSIYRFLRTVPPAHNYVGPTFRSESEDPLKDPGAAIAG